MVHGRALWTHGSGDARRGDEIFRASAPGALALFAAFLLAYAGGPAPSEKSSWNFKNAEAISWTTPQMWKRKKRTRIWNIVLVSA